jgi:hypothetical protein
MFTLILKAILAWSLIAPLAILNGMFRELVLLPTFGAPIALPVSGVLLALTIAFKFGCGRRKNPG